MAAARVKRPPKQWILPCSNAEAGQMSKDVHMTWLNWSPAASPRRPGSVSELNRSGQLRNTGDGFRRKAAKQAGGLADTTVLTFSQVTWLPSVQWARQCALETRRQEIAATEKAQKAHALKHSQSEPQLHISAGRKLGHRGKPRTASPATSLQTPSTSSGALPDLGSGVESGKRRQVVAMEQQPFAASAEGDQDTSTVQARVLAGSRRTQRGSGLSLKTSPPRSAEDREEEKPSAPSKKEAAAPTKKEAPMKRASTVDSNDSTHKTREPFKATFVDRRSAPTPTKDEGRIKRSRASLKKMKSEHFKQQSIYETLDKRTVRLVFWKFADGGAIIAHSNLRPALLLLGYKDVTENDVDRVAKDTVGRGGLKYEEYETFCEAFDQVYMMGASKGFRDADIDGNGRLTSAELGILLQKQGITAMPGLVEELLAEVGSAEAGLASLDEYLKLVDIVRQRGGFTRAETEEFRTLFNRYDFNGNGTIDRQEFIAALKWLGFVQAQHKSTTLMFLLEGIEREGGEVMEPEFLQAMRRYREFEISWISDLFKEQDLDGVAVISPEAVVNVFKKLGFRLANTFAVDECAIEAKCASRTEFFFEDVVLMVRFLRAREGFLKKDVQEYRQVFDLNDTDGSGLIDVVELGGVLRMLGNPACVEIQQNLMEEVDVDKSGFLDFNEFLKAMRWFQEKELDTLEVLFKEADVDNSGTLNFNEFKVLYRVLGYDPTKQQMKQLRERFMERDACFDECYEAVGVLKEQLRQRFLECCGFSQKELRVLKEFFHVHEEGKSVPRSSLVKKMHEVLPDDPESEIALVDNLMEKLDFDKSGALEWNEFLKFMRLVQDKKDFAVLAQEEKAARDGGFSREQVIEFRKIFKMCDADDSKQVDFEELTELFGKIMPMDISAIFKLREALEERDMDISKGLCFEQFLRIMADIANNKFFVEGGTAKRRSLLNLASKRKSAH